VVVLRGGVIVTEMMVEVMVEEDVLLPLRGQTVVVVGMGYVGLPTALSLVSKGARVMGLDASAARLRNIHHGSVDLSARDMERLRQYRSGAQLDLSEDPEVLSDADYVVICVPTPVDDYQAPDLAALQGACDSVVERAKAGQTIILTSTTYVGCTRKMLVEPLAARGLVAGQDISVVFSPERINPGVADHMPELTPRVVGGTTANCLLAGQEFLSHISSTVHVVTSLETAEMTKLMENTFRAVNIALANEFSDVANELGVDIVEAVDAAATKPYGFMAFYPGAGVGGHCIPCDPHYLLWQLRGRRVIAPVIQSAMEAISVRPRRVVERARMVLGESGRTLANARVLVVGVTYKPGVADVRESPALEIIDGLMHLGAKVSYVDPFVPALDTPLGGRLLSQTNADQFAKIWDLVIVHTVHPGQDYGWLENSFAVLDTTYRLDFPNRHVL